MAHPNAPRAIKSLLTYAPLPNLIAMPAVGIDISERSLRYIYLSRDPDVRDVAFYGEYELAPTAIRRGEVADASALREPLRRVREEYGVRFARLSLPEERSYLFRTRIAAGASVAEARTMIEFQLEEHVPVAPEEAVFDYQPIRRRLPAEASPARRRFDAGGAQAGEDGLEVAVSVFPKRIIDTYQAVLDDVGIMPLSFEIEPHAFARAVLPSRDAGTFLIARIGEVRTSVAVARAGLVHYTASLDIGGEQFVEALQSNADLDAQRAREALWEHGVGRRRDNDDEFEAIANTAAALRDELRRHCSYWNEQHHADDTEHTGIDTIIVTGRYATVPGLCDFLGATQTVPVAVGDVWRHAFSLADYVPPVPAREAPGYGTAVGLALRASGVD